MSEDTLRDELKAMIAETVKHESKPKDVLKALRKRHPKAKSKDLALAAFAVMIDVADHDGELADALHHVALSARSGHDSDDHHEDLAEPVEPAEQQNPA